MSGSGEAVSVSPFSFRDITPSTLILRRVGYRIRSLGRRLAEIVTPESILSERLDEGCMGCALGIGQA
jgi:hypothetical protein